METSLINMVSDDCAWSLSLRGALHLGRPSQSSVELQSSLGLVAAYDAMSSIGDASQ